MSDPTSAPASVTDADECRSSARQTQSGYVDETLRVSSANRTQSDDVADGTSASSRAVSDDSGSDPRSDEDDGSEFRTATRLLRLLKLALGTLVSFLTALKLLGVL